MNLLETILAAQNGGAVQQLGRQFGLGQDQTTAALSALVPALAAGFSRNLQQEGGPGRPGLGALRRPSHPVPR